MRNIGDFPTSSPEAQGVSSAGIRTFLESLEAKGVALHSFLLMRNDHLVFETYCQPYERNSLHRMFSITKSFTSLAIGFLVGDGSLRLDDKVAVFFPDKLPSAPHPDTLSMTVEDLLTMRTTHRMSTYRLVDDPDWVRSFFTVPPDRKPGASFAYDTSATHVLCALVEQLSKQSLLSFLRERLLNSLGFSSSAYMLTNSFGQTLGGSGLMCTPLDVLRVLHWVSHGGVYPGCGRMQGDYLALAISKRCDTIIFPGANTYDFMQGYGYQFWRTAYGGVACYGMGGQLAVCLPEEKLLFVTTADTLGREGGVQLIFDAFYLHIWPVLQSRALLETCPMQDGLTEKSASRTLAWIKPLAAPVKCFQDGRVYLFTENPLGLERMSLHLQSGKEILRWCRRGENFSLAFGCGANVFSTFPGTGSRCAASGAWREEGQFLVKVQFIDERIGNMLIQLSFSGERVSIAVRQFVEEPIEGMDGFAEGVSVV